MYPYSLLPESWKIEIHLYGVMIAIGVLFAFGVLFYYSKKKGVEERFTDFISLCFQECISHTTTDNQCVAFLKKVGDNIQFVCNLCTTKDSNERSYRTFYCVTEEVDFFLHQVANYIFATFSRDAFCNTFYGSMCSVGRTECITYIVISKIS